MLCGSDVTAAEVEEVIDLIVGREEALRLTGRFELLHLPLSSACRLVRILRSVIEALVLAMLNAGHDLPLGRAVAGKLVGDHDTGRPHLPLQQLANQLDGRNACLAWYRSRPSDRWHLDKMVVQITGKHMYLWRAGTVNLSGRVSRMRTTGGEHGGLLPTRATDFGPDLEFLGPGSSMLGGRDRGAGGRGY